jgi:tetratricopeptide (TPR) repeat protein
LAKPASLAAPSRSSCGSKAAGNEADALAALGRADEAVAAADRAVELSADDRRRLQMRLFRVGVLTRAERYPAALAEARALLREHSQPGELRDIRYRLSNVYASMGDYDRAEEQLETILKADPGDAAASNDLGYFWADQGKNLDEAERLIRKAIALDEQQRAGGPSGADEENYAYLDSLGWVLFRRGQPEEARRWLEKAADAAGTAGDPVVWDHLGDVYLRLEDKARARAAWQRALKMYERHKQRKNDEHYEQLKQKLQRHAAETQ